LTTVLVEAVVIMMQVQWWNNSSSVLVVKLTVANSVEHSPLEKVIVLNLDKDILRILCYQRFSTLFTGICYWFISLT
jgi:hypothetical protein